MHNQNLQELAVSFIKDRQLELTEKNKINIYENLISHRDNILKDTEYYEYLLEGGYLVQQRYFYSYLDDELEVTQEMFDMFTLASLALTTVFAYLAYHPNALKIALIRLGTKVTDFVKSFSDKTEATNTFKWSKKQYISIKVAERILEDQYSGCVTKCGVVGKLQVSDIKLGTSFLNAPNIPDDAKPNDVACVITCTLDYLTSVIAELHKTLVNCNQNYSDKNNPDSPVNAINFDANCSEIKKYLKEIVEEFEEIVETIYQDNHKGKNKWKEILDDKINAALKNQSVAKYGPTDSEYKTLQLDFRDNATQKPKFGSSDNYKGKNPNANFRRN